MVKKRELRMLQENNFLQIDTENHRISVVFLSIDFKSLAGELLFFAENILLIYYSSDK